MMAAGFRVSEGTAPQLRLGIIGLGGATTQILPSFAAHPHVRIVAGTDLRPSTRDNFAADFGALAYEEAERLCAAPDLDAVYIATPHQLHREHVTMAAAHGKHVLVEKPMALTLEDCDAMIAAAEAAAVHLIVGHTHSFNPAVMKMREIIRSGELGPLAMINMFSYGNFLYRPRRPEELRTEHGGGVIYNQAPHQVDVARLLGGGVVRSVRAMTWVLDPSRPTEGSYMAFLQFVGGATASLTFSGYDHFDSDEFHYWVGELGERRPAGGHGRARASLLRMGGERAEIAFKEARGYGVAKPGGAPSAWHQPHCGVAIVSCAGGDMRPSADGLTIYDRDGMREIAMPAARAFPDKGGVIDELYDAVAGHRAPLHNGRWAKATMEVAEGIRLSAQEGREVFMSQQVAVEA